MKTTVVVGTWRITDMQLWDADYLDMQAPAHLTIRRDLTGEIQFGLVHGDIKARIEYLSGLARVEFDWSGADENDPARGHGWMGVTGDRANGRIFIDQGDDSGFTAVRAG